MQVLSSAEYETKFAVVHITPQSDELLYVISLVLCVIPYAAYLVAVCRADWDIGKGGRVSQPLGTDGHRRSHQYVVAVTVAAVDNSRRKEVSLQVRVDNIQVVRGNVSDVVSRLQRSVYSEKPLSSRRC